VKGLGKAQRRDEAPNTVEMSLITRTSTAVVPPHQYRQKPFPLFPGCRDPGASHATRRTGRAADRRHPQGLPPAPLPPPLLPPSAPAPPPPLLLFLPGPLASASAATPRASPDRQRRLLRRSRAPHPRIPSHGLGGRRRPPPPAAPRYLPPPQPLPPPARPRRLGRRTRAACPEGAGWSRPPQRPCCRGSRVLQPARRVRASRDAARCRAAAAAQPRMGLVRTPRRRRLPAGHPRW
jgi:hypothetical protein